MPASLRAWYTPADFESLAAHTRVLAGEFSVADMDRLTEHLGSAAGSCEAWFAFSRREPGWIGLEVTLQAVLTVTCQRCLEPLNLEIAERVEVGLIDTDHTTAVLPEGIESVVLEGDRFSPQRLVEDELIMAVPLIPKHAPEQCAVDTDSLPDGVFTLSGAAKTN